MKKIRKAVIPAAGYGTRFLPATKATPKEMLPIVDKPTIQYIVEEALQSGIEEILIISGHAKRAIEDHFDTNIALELNLEEHHKTDLLRMVRSISEINIHYIRQKHMRGLGDAILCAQSFIDDEPFAVLLGDDVVYNETNPALQQMIDIYNSLGTTILGCQEVPQEKVSSYGIVKGVPTDDPRLMRVVNMIEKPSVAEAPSRTAVLGRYIITPDVFEVLRRTEPGERRRNPADRCPADHGSPGSGLCLLFSGKRYDVGDKLGFLKATVEYALRRPDLGDQFRDYLKSLSL